MIPRAKALAMAVFVLETVVLAGLAAPNSFAQSDFKVGVFDYQGVFEGSAEGKRVQSSLEEKRQQWRVTVDAREQEAKALQAKLLEGQFTLSPDKKDEIEKDLQRKIVALDSLRQEATNNLKLEIDDAKAMIERRLVETVNELGSQQGFTLIFERKSQVIFASPLVDVTPLVIDRLNAKYPQTPGIAPPKD